MKRLSCHKCGGYKLIADRALGGKIICTDCGTPYELRNNYSSYKFSSNLATKRNKRFIFFAALTILIIFVLF